MLRCNLQNNTYWNSIGSATAKKSVDTLLILGAEQIRPLLLAAMQFFKADELSKLLKHTVSWSYRLIIAGRSGSGSIEKAYCLTAMNIRNGKLKSTSDVRRNLTDIIPSDDEFRGSFAVSRITKDKVARYTMYAINNLKKAQSSNNSELVTNDDAGKVNLEHILPKRSKEDEWTSFSPEQKGAYTYRIGNMTLLGAKANKNLGNKSWPEKKAVYASSDLPLNKEIAEYDDWTAETIEERQSNLAKLAVQIWKL